MTLLGTAAALSVDPLPVLVKTVPILVVRTAAAVIMLSFVSARGLSSFSASFVGGVVRPQSGLGLFLVLIPVPFATVTVRSILKRRRKTLLERS